jgi:hypothetical protein
MHAHVAGAGPVTMLVPQSLFPSNLSLLERHPAQMVAIRQTATTSAIVGSVSVLQTPVPLPDGDRHFVVGSIVCHLTSAMSSGNGDLRDLQLNLVDSRSLGLIVRLARWQALNGRVGDQSRSEGMTTFGNGSSRTFNFTSDLKGLILPNLYSLQFVTSFQQNTGTFTSQTLEVDIMGYAIPVGLLLR